MPLARCDAQIVVCGRGSRKHNLIDLTHLPCYKDQFRGVSLAWDGKNSVARGQHARNADAAKLNTQLKPFSGSVFGTG